MTVDDILFKNSNDGKLLKLWVKSTCQLYSFCKSWCWRIVRRWRQGKWVWRESRTWFACCTINHFRWSSWCSCSCSYWWWCHTLVLTIWYYCDWWTIDECTETSGEREVECFAPMRLKMHLLQHHYVLLYPSDSFKWRYI